MTLSLLSVATKNLGHVGYNMWIIRFSEFPVWAI